MPLRRRSSTRRAPSAAFLAIFTLAIGCGGRDTSAASTLDGSAELYVHSFVPTPGSPTGASYDRQATFTQSTCASSTSTVGPCTINPCFISSSSDAGSLAPSNAGTITIDGAEMPPLSLAPQPSGYTPSTVDGQIAWTTGGEPVTFQWTNSPGNAGGGGGALTLSTPPYIALTATSAFVTRTTTLARTTDVTVSWTSDTLPTATDQVAVDLASSSTQLVCIFPVSAGSGVIPSEALALVPSGSGSYNVHSKQGKTLADVDGSRWSMGFNVDAQARADDGLAKGSITFQ